MPVVIKIPPALRKVFNEDAEAAFIDVLNQFDAEQRNGFGRGLETHLQAFKEYVDRRLVENEAKLEKRFAEFEAKMEKRFAEMNAYMDRRFGAVDARFAGLDARFAGLDARFAEADAKMEKRLAEYHKSLLRWMFTFFIGTVLTLLGFFITFLQLSTKL